jgi:hypothetical protein
MEAIKPSVRYTDFMLVYFKKYDNEADRARIRSVWLLRSTDEQIIADLERLPDLIKQ